MSNNSLLAKLQANLGPTLRKTLLNNSLSIPKSALAQIEQQAILPLAKSMENALQSQTKPARPQKLPQVLKDFGTQEVEPGREEPTQPIQQQQQQQQLPHQSQAPAKESRSPAAQEALPASGPVNPTDAANNIPITAEADKTTKITKQRIKTGGYGLPDTEWITSQLKQLGKQEKHIKKQLGAKEKERAKTVKPFERKIAVQKIMRTYLLIGMAFVAILMLITIFIFSGFFGPILLRLHYLRKKLRDNIRTLETEKTNAYEAAAANLGIPQLTEVLLRVQNQSQVLAAQYNQQLAYG